MNLSRQAMIDAIDRESKLSDELFLEIVQVEDYLEKTELIEAVRAKCRETGRVQEFNNLLKAWQHKYSQLCKQEASNKTEFTDAPLVLNCGRYKATDTGVLIHDVSPNGTPTTSIACPHPILPVERLINIDSETEKLKIAFFKDARWSSLVADCNTVYNKNNISSLADRGILVTSENARELVRYLAEVVSLNAAEIPLYRSLSRLGWVDGEFAPYIKDVKYDGDADFKNVYSHVRNQGDFDKWKEHVLKLRKDLNIRLMLAASFASPLIELVGALSFVLHIWGTTGFGKTVSLMVAASVWGNPEMGCLTRTMNMTQNAMARTAAFLRNLPFCADELQQIKTRWNNTYDQLIMYLTEGIDRGRAKTRGGVEEMRTWKLAFVLTGEEPITRSVSGGGVRNRVIEVECDRKIIQDGNYTANLVKDNYGFAGQLYIEYIQKHCKVDELRSRFRELTAEILREADTTDKQASSMALMLLADELACKCVFGDEPLRVQDVKGFVISERMIRTEERAYQEVLALIARNRNKFAPDAQDCWGRIDDDTVMINKQVLEQEMRKLGFEFNAVKKAWAKEGYLIRNSQGRVLHQTTMYGVRTTCIKLFTPNGEDLTEEEHEIIEKIFQPDLDGLKKNILLRKK